MEGLEKRGEQERRGREEEKKGGEEGFMGRTEESRER